MRGKGLRGRPAIASASGNKASRDGRIVSASEPSRRLERRTDWNAVHGVTSAETSSGTVWSVSGRPSGTAKRGGDGNQLGLSVALSQAEFGVLVDEHGPALYRMAYRMVGDSHEAEDLVQEAFRSAWKSRARYQAGRGDRAWLTSILRRRVVDRWRKRKPPVPLSGEESLELSVDAEDPLANEYCDEMQAALDTLPHDLRETLLLVVVGELTHQEVADLMAIPLGTVLSRVSRARRRLREALVSPRC